MTRSALLIVDSSVGVLGSTLPSLLIPVGRFGEPTRVAHQSYGSGALASSNLLVSVRYHALQPGMDADVTYIRVRRGFMYLTAVMGWYSHYVVAWQLSNTLDGRFCLDALDLALKKRKPDIFNTDQGAQFAALAFTSRLHEAEIRASMDGRGRAFDNVSVERLWRTVKYEHVYLYDYATVIELEKGLGQYFTFYNNERPHQSLAYQTPAEVHLRPIPTVN